MNNLKNSTIYSKFADIFFKKSIIGALLIVYAIMVIVFASLNRDFVSIGNIKNILINLAIPGILAIGVTTVMIGGNMDVSVGSIVGVTSVIVAKLYNIKGVSIPIPFVILAALGVGLIIGAINGYLVVGIGVNSVVTTLGTMAILRGLAYLYQSESAVIYYKPFLAIGRASIFKNIPITTIYYLVIIAVIYLILRFTKFGKNLYATGANIFVSNLCGIKVKKVQFITFIISGITAAMGGLLMATYLSYADGSFGEGLEFKVLTICVLGGISLAGGRGTLIGVLVATLVIGSISSGLVMVGVSEHYKEIFYGAILIMAIFIDSFRFNRNDII